MPQCVAIKNDGLRCSARSGTEREHGGVRCATHWRRVSDLINIHGVENGLMQNRALEGRLIMDGPRVRERAAAVRAAQLIRAQANRDEWENGVGDRARGAEVRSGRTAR